MEVSRPLIKKVFYREKTFLEKRLPREGEITVKVGDEVDPFTIVGYTFLSLEKQFFDLEKREWVLKVSDGQPLNMGDLLAQKRGILSLRRERLSMPFTGSVSVRDFGKALKITALSSPERFSLSAGIKAKVAKIFDREAVLLETPAYLICGAQALGGEAIGEIRVVADPVSPLMLSSLSPSLAGKIIVGGSYVSPEVINKAQAVGVSGMVVGGISAAVTKPSLPVLVIEGFGKIPMNQDVYDRLKEEELKTAVISPSRQQVIIPISPKSNEEGVEILSQSASLTVGSLVQVFVWPNFGHYGTLAEISAAPKKFSSGVEDFSVRVKLDNGDQVESPLSNIGILRSGLELPS